MTIEVTGLPVPNGTLPLRAVDGAFVVNWTKSGRIYFLTGRIDASSVSNFTRAARASSATFSAWTARFSASAASSAKIVITCRFSVESREDEMSSSVNPMTKTSAEALPILDFQEDVMRLVNSTNDSMVTPTNTKNKPK